MSLLCVVGYVRGANLSPDDLVHVCDVGDLQVTAHVIVSCDVIVCGTLQIESIEALADPLSTRKSKSNGLIVNCLGCCVVLFMYDAEIDVDLEVWKPDAEQESLQVRSWFERV
jgi:hypothetical protein